MKHTPRLLPAVRAALADIPRSKLQSVTDATGVPLGTVKRIRYEDGCNPRVNAVERLAVYLLGANIINIRLTESASRAPADG